MRSIRRGGDGATSYGIVDAHDHFAIRTMVHRSKQAAGSRPQAKRAGSTSTVRTRATSPGRVGARTAQTPYDLLLERILLGEYAPGASLFENEIADELGVSRTPVREAFLRLKVEGLVNIIPRGGTFVNQASMFLIQEITETRVVLEDYLAQLVVERHTAGWLDMFREWLQSVEAIGRETKHRDWMRKDAEFHDLIDAAANNRTLSNHLRILRQQAVLFWGQSTHRTDSLDDILKDFQNALVAIEAKDAERLSDVLRNHCLDHVKRVQSYMSPKPRRPLRAALSRV